MLLPIVEPVEDNGVDHWPWHSQPIERQIHVLHVAAAGDRVVMIGVDKVPVVWQPTQGEYRNYYYKHAHNLDKVEQQLKQPTSYINDINFTVL